MGSPQGSEGKASGQKGGNLRRQRTGVERAAALRDGSWVCGPVAASFGKRENRFEGAPAPAGFTGLDERRTTRGTADLRRTGEARFMGSPVP